MPFKTNHTLNTVFSNVLAYGRYLFLVWPCIFQTLGSAQDIPYGSISDIATAEAIPERSKRAVDSLLKSAPQGFGEIHAVLGHKRADTVFMRYVARLAAAKKYVAGECYALNQLGRSYRNISRYAQAIALHEKALEVAKKTDNLEFTVNSLNYLGVAYRRISSVRTAMDYNQKALVLAESVNNPSDGIKRSINVSLNSIGNLYQGLKQYDLAIATFRKSLKLEDRLNNKLGLAINYQNIGECQELQGKFTDALENYEKSLSYNAQIDSDMGRVICNTSIAQVFIKIGNPYKAKVLLKKSLAMAKELGDGFLIAPVKINLGWAQMLGNDYDAAEKNMLDGLKMAIKYNLGEYTSRTNHLLSDLYKRKQDFKKALAYKTRAQEVDDKILEESTIRYVNDIIFRYDSEKKNREIERLVEQNNLNQLELRKNRTNFVIGAIALALLLGIFYILYRQFQLSNEKKVLTLEQSMLRSQMNPHFLFNSLNSIKLYIINNEKKNAVYYLNKFSKLVRKILEASSLKEIPLVEELETVALYMNIENIRFSNEIDFNVHIQEEIDVHAIKIPSLILQPFLENALWHGLSSKEGDKKIDLYIHKRDSNFIIITITDNGVGREASEKIKKSKVLKRKSVGIDITKERLANFSRDYQNSVNVDIVDLYDKDNKACGTKVVLNIPTV